MQTFVTNSPASFVGTVGLGEHIARSTAQHLDNKRLGKQRVEAKQILQGSFPHHPATKMWDGCQKSLATYGFWMCVEWRNRGFADSLLPYFREAAAIGGWAAGKYGSLWPWWFGDPNMVQTHRSKLIQKMPEHYADAWPPGLETRCLYTDFILPYIWPDPHEEGRWFLSKAELKRADEWEVPEYWYISSDGEVTFS